MLAQPKYWLRWLVVVPGGLLAAVALFFPLHWAVLAITSQADGVLGIGPNLSEIPPRTLERLGMAFLSTFSVVYFGAPIAPAW